jgi:hypothetical protein
MENAALDFQINTIKTAFDDLIDIEYMKSSKNAFYSLIRLYNTLDSAFKVVAPNAVTAKCYAMKAKWDIALIAAKETPFNVAIIEIVDSLGKALDILLIEQEKSKNSIVNLGGRELLN